jgi:predicted GTPase
MNLGDEARKAYHTLLESRGRVNILIAGRVGVGKSTLVNAVFQGNLTATGQGRPVTPNTREICKEGVPVCIFDTRGMEMADFQKTLQALETLVHTRRAELDPHRHIHVAWICIAEDLRQVESAEISLVDMLAKYMPVMAVITKARADQGFKQVVQDLLPAARNVTRVRALEETFDDGHVLPAMGLQELVTATMEVVPEGHRNAFAAAQKVSIDLKKSQAHKAVASAVLLAGAAAASPIPHLGRRTPGPNSSRDVGRHYAHLRCADRGWFPKCIGGQCGGKCRHSGRRAHYCRGAAQADPRGGYAYWPAHFRGRRRDPNNHPRGGLYCRVGHAVRESRRRAAFA